MTSARQCLPPIPPPPLRPPLCPPKVLAWLLAVADSRPTFGICLTCCQYMLDIARSRQNTHRRCFRPVEPHRHCTEILLPPAEIPLENSTVYTLLFSTHVKGQGGSGHAGGEQSHSHIVYIVADRILAPHSARCKGHTIPTCRSSSRIQGSQSNRFLQGIVGPSLFTQATTVRKHVDIGTEGLSLTLVPQ